MALCFLFKKEKQLEEEQKTTAKKRKFPKSKEYRRSNKKRCIPQPVTDMPPKQRPGWEPATATQDVGTPAGRVGGSLHRCWEESGELVRLVANIGGTAGGERLVMFWGGGDQIEVRL